jgi:myo-inositol-1(or 4)-monophosphatase
LPEADAADGLDADLDLVAGAAHEAAALAMRYFRREPEVWMKAGDSPVTEADIALDRFLRDALTSARPDYGWLSEETADSPERLRAARTFVVDPIDGTRAFIDGLPTWCVSVAVVEEGRPLVGVLDCPAKEEVYLAQLSRGATRNGVPVAVAASSGKYRIGGPRALIEAAAGALRRDFEKAPYVPSLAYRLAMVASGRLDATFVKANSHDWDLAAADLVLSEAGGKVLDRRGARPLYATAVTRHGPLVAGSGALLETIAAVIRNGESGAAAGL